MNTSGSEPTANPDPRTKKWILWNMDRFGQKEIEVNGHIIPVKRHWSERFTSAVWMIILRVTLWFMKQEKSDEPTPFQKMVFWGIGYSVSSIPALLIYFALFWTSLFLIIWKSLVDFATTSTAGFIFAYCFLLMIPLIAYLLRRYFRTFYGGAELLFAGLGIYYGLLESTKDSPDSIKLFLSVGGGIYVMVRALDNIQQGWTEAVCIWNGSMKKPERQEVKIQI
tara:strand:- start:1667 stop:2338 length:672 start_codon:yes stop_codon:yes gene_type:complete